MLLDTALNLNHRTKKLKDHEEYILKTNIIAESAKLKNQLSQTQKKLSSLNNEIGNKFIKSEIKENELKKHISSLNSKLYSSSLVTNDMNGKIEILHGEIMEMISIIQEKVRNQINFTRLEMEKEVSEKFNEAERKQKELMNQKMEEQKKVFDRMNYTKGELEKIRKKFEETNIQCEELCKKNEILKVQLDTTKKSNDSLEQKLVSLQREHNKVEKDYNYLVMNGSSHNNSKTDFLLQSFEKDSKAQSKMKSRLYSATQKNNTDNNKNNLIKTMKENIEHVKQDYNKAYKSFIECQKEKTEAQQLLQKCIEDITIQLNSLHSRMSNDSNGNNSTNYLIAIQNLERKLKILTFVYDNGLQNLKTKKSLLLNK